MPNEELEEQGTPAEGESAESITSQADEAVIGEQDDEQSIGEQTEQPAEESVEQASNAPAGGAFDEASADAASALSSLEEPEAMIGDGDDGMISQDELDALLSGQGGAAGEQIISDDAVMIGDDISQDELDAVLAESGLGGAGAAPSGKPSAKPTGSNVISGGGSTAASQFSPPSVDGGEAPGSDADSQAIDLINDVSLNVRVELGRSELMIEDVLKLGAGSVVELDKLAGDPVDIFVNERLVARGEVLVLNDDFCVRISEIVMPMQDVA